MTDAAEMAAKAAPIGHGRLQWRILMGFVLGLAAGLLAYTFARVAAWVALGIELADQRRDVRLEQAVADDDGCQPELEDSRVWNRDGEEARRHDDGAQQPYVTTEGALGVWSGRRRNGHPLILGRASLIPVLFLSLMSRHDRACAGACRCDDRSAHER